jgi:hypothetical protein
MFQTIAVPMPDWMLQYVMRRELIRQAVRYDIGGCE